MAARPKVTIDPRQLAIELTASDPILKRVAEETMREAFFDPAVAAMKAEWGAHPITQELAGGVGATNVSNTLEGSFRDENGDVPPNLWGFLGFDAKGGMSPEGALEPIARRLDPTDPDGPKLVYEGRDKAKLVYRFRVEAPNEAAIWSGTSMPWAKGLSWVKRIEQGIPGITHFLNVDRASSRSGGGIQVAGVVRSGRYRPTSYMTRIFNNFLRRAGGLSPNGRKAG